MATSDDINARLSEIEKFIDEDLSDAVGALQEVGKSFRDDDASTMIGALGSAIDAIDTVKQLLGEMDDLRSQLGDE